MRKWIQMIQKLFSKRPKITRTLPTEKVEEESKKQKDSGEKRENLQKSTCSQEILLSVHRIYEKHAECSENLLREITKLTDIIENTQKTNGAEMQSAVPLSVSRASAPAQKSLLPFGTTSSFFSLARIRLPPLKKLQDSRVESSMISNVDTDDVKPSQLPKLSWDDNQCCKNTEERNSHVNDVELQTVDVTSTEEEAIGPMIYDILNEPLDKKARLLEIKFNAKIAEWSEYKKKERVKLKVEMDEAKQREQKEIKDLKLKVKFLEKEAKREKQEEKKKLKDLQQKIKNEKSSSKLLLELKELKKKLEMEEKEECNRKKIEKHTEVDEEEHEAEDKQALKSKFKITFKFRGCNGRKNSI